LIAGGIPRFNRAMRAVVQRATRASVTVADEGVGTIGRGLVVLVAAGAGDGPADVAYLVDKIVNLRVFPDDDGKMNRSLLEVGGGVLAVSQFTLYGDARRGRRPGFIDAMEPVAAEALYQEVIAGLRAAGVAEVATGRFRTEMQVELVNDGPVTILLDSKKLF
jgi:D-aminoacyl-tRNA deacylase